MTNPYIPNFSGLSKKDALDLRLLFQRFHELNAEVQAIPRPWTPAQIRALSAVSQQVQVPAQADPQLNPGGATIGIPGISFVNAAGSGVILQGLYSARPSPAGSSAGSIFYATDQDVYYTLVSGAWKYAAGVMRGTINPDTKPVLIAADDGFLFYDTVYQHTYRWDGAAWGYAPGDDGSGYIRNFTVAPRTGKWQLCDGTAAIKESLANGTDALVAFSALAAGTMPNLTGTPSYARWNSACTGTVNAAAAPTISGNTGDTSAGTPSGTNSAPAFTGNAAPTSVANTALGADVAVIFPYTPTGSVAAPVFTGNAMATHHHDGSTLVVSTATQMRNLDVLPYYRQ